MITERLKNFREKIIGVQVLAVDIDTVVLRTRRGKEIIFSISTKYTDLDKVFFALKRKCSLEEYSRLVKLVIQKRDGRGQDSQREENFMNIIDLESRYGIGLINGDNGYGVLCRRALKALYDYNFNRVNKIR